MKPPVTTDAISCNRKGMMVMILIIKKRNKKNNKRKKYVNHYCTKIPSGVRGRRDSIVE